MGNFCFKQVNIADTNVTDTNVTDTDTTTEIEEPIFDPDHEECIPGHKLNQSNHYVVNYPDHIKRKDSSIYKKTHHQLCHIQDTPCFICGKTQKINKI